MSVVGSLYTGAAGLRSHGKAINVLGDNVANANTMGFKRSRANFSDVFARSVGAGSDGDIGQGSEVTSVQKLMQQGALLGTGQATDLAIKGNGFFAVKGNSQGLSGSFYTRAGQFHLDKDGQLVNQSGLVAQGYLASSDGTINKSVTDLKIPLTTMPPKATTKGTVVGNLDAGATAITSAFSATDATNTSNYSSQITVYDSLGKAHTVTMYFRKSSATAWTFHGVVDGGEVSGGSSGSPTVVMSGTLTFDSQGRLASVTGNAATITFANAAAQTISLNLGDATATSGNTGLKGMTSYASSSTVSYVSQDGYTAGNMSGIAVTSTGVIQGVFSNGKKRDLGQVLLADFKSAQDLQRVGGNLYTETVASGQAVLNQAGNAGMGTLASGNLEQSNVDLASEFVGLIAYQRGFQANSRTVSTADQMLREILSLKR